MSPQRDFKIVTSKKRRSDPVVLVVGLEKEVFAISQALLVDSIECFRTAFLRGRSREGIEKEMYFEEEKPEAIKLLVGWLQKTKVNLNFASQIFRNFWELRISADKWCAERLANDVSDIILALRGLNIPFEHRDAWKLSDNDTSAIWQLSVPDSSVRKLCIQCLAWEFREDLDDPRDGSVIGLLIINRLRSIVDMPDYIAEDIQAGFDRSKPCDFQYKYNISWHDKRDRDRCAFHDHRVGQSKCEEAKYSVDTTNVLDMSGFLIRKPKVNQAWNDGGKEVINGIFDYGIC
ncbi:putative btb poz domain containing protein [Botrytis fragariae]|uniref:Putative btb poz domain containing protein n=1 Tax=Botrytis fragariae TaxID=1964551 RepID=A0A8H6B2I3_9HELO|nr:putative btb poz domain containing protein [Botrytis fragariae]KAF5877975.1 putative btb poz domain containing protein [Botrytis fragariae]